MKKRLLSLLSLSLIAILALAACTSTPTVETAPLPDSEQSPAEPLGPLSDAEMEALIIEKIEDEHSLEFILEQDMTAEEWSKVLDRMIGYGADINPEEKELIIEWLVNRNK
ncbi:MAG TPA: hypothetical protein GX730_02745 [Chloroflexi bacterium]|mgnify:CR=1 FL=1|jgi:hypothetical protein|nr:hypothetical protein [Chloroflexota bacterium]